MNMALQSRVLDRSKLVGHARDFAKVYHISERNVVDHDFVGSDGLCLPAFCAEREDGTVHAIGLNFPSARTVFGFRNSRDLFQNSGIAPVVRACLIFNRSHIWCAIPGWHLDSMRHPTRIARRVTPLAATTWCCC